MILPPAIALVRRLELGSANLLIDVGAGTGALLAAIRSAAPTARTVALDASEQMLRVARMHGTSAVLGDALAVPLRPRARTPSSWPTCCLTGRPGAGAH